MKSSWKIVSVLLASGFMLSGLNAYATSAGSMLSGKWSGSGTAYLNLLGDIAVSCSLDAQPAGESIVMKGVCRKGPFSRRLNMTVKSAGGDNYTGTYSGTRDGVARLHGVMSGNRLVMDIAWPKTVNGDKVARMSLVQSSADMFSLEVNDLVDGQPRVTSRFNFKRR